MVWGNKSKELADAVEFRYPVSSRGKAQRSQSAILRTEPLPCCMELAWSRNVLERRESEIGAPSVLDKGRDWPFGEDYLKGKTSALE